MPGVLSKPRRQPTTLYSDVVRDIFMCLPRRHTAAAAYAGRPFTGPFFINTHELPLQSVKLGCRHPGEHVSIHDDTLLTTIATKDFAERLPCFKDNMVVSLFYVASPLSLDGDPLPFEQENFDSIIAHVLRPMCSLLEGVDVNISQWPTDRSKLKLFMSYLADARMIRHVPETPVHMDMSTWFSPDPWGFMTFNGKNVYSLEVGRNTFLLIF